MKKPHPAFVASLAMLYLAGCMSVQVRPLPDPGERRPGSIRGVVLRGAGEGERIEFGRVDHVEWADSAVTLVGVLRAPAARDATQTRNAAPRDAVTRRTFPLASVSGLLIREVDPNRTSLVIAVVGVSTLVIGALLFTGKTDEGTVLTGDRRRR